MLLNFLDYPNEPQVPMKRTAHLTAIRSSSKVKTGGSSSSVTR